MLLKNDMMCYSRLVVVNSARTEPDTPVALDMEHQLHYSSKNSRSCPEISFCGVPDASNL
jgi:hypothetical protein